MPLKKEAPDSFEPVLPDIYYELNLFNRALLIPVAEYIHSE
jgi:hypothetical protein